MAYIQPSNQRHTVYILFFFFFFLKFQGYLYKRQNNLSEYPVGQLARSFHTQTFTVLVSPFKTQLKIFGPSSLLAIHEDDGKKLDRLWMFASETRMQLCKANVRVSKHYGGHF